MTDLEKWKHLLDEMGIKYEVNHYTDYYINYEIENVDCIILEINYNHLNSTFNYDVDLYIIFKKEDESFICFEPFEG